MALSHGGRILLTGASGFVGQALLQRLRADGKLVRGVVREGELSHDSVRGPSLGRDALWTPLLAGCDVVVHAAARAHMTTERARDPLAVFREVNTLGTLNLARQAAAEGVRLRRARHSLSAIRRGRWMPMASPKPRPRMVCASLRSRRAWSW